MRKVNGTVTETLIVQKEVEVEVADSASKEEIEQAIRTKAYEKNILQGDHGWDGVESQGVEISFGGPVKASYPTGRCPDCGQMIGDSVEEGEECSNCGHVFWIYV